MSIMDDFIFSVINTILQATQKAYDNNIKYDLLTLRVSSSQWDDLIRYYPVHFVDNSFNIYDFDGKPMLSLCTDELEKLEHSIRNEMTKRLAIMVNGYWFRVEIDDSVEEPKVIVRL